MAIPTFVRWSSPGRLAGVLAIAISASFLGCFAGPAPAPSGSAAAPAPKSASTATTLDLDSVGNVAITDYEGVPAGEHELGGVVFRIGDSALRVGGRSFPDFARGVTGIPVGRSFRVARFLHATNGGGYQQPGHPKHEFDGVHVGDYVIRYADGTSETIPLRYGHELRDWWNWDKSQATTNADVVWTGENPDAAKYDVKVRLYATSWLNPHPAKQVATIDLVSANAKAAPFCVAISVDDDPSFVPRADAATFPSVAPRDSSPPIEVAARTSDAPTSPTTPDPTELFEPMDDPPSPETSTDEPEIAQAPSATVTDPTAADNAPASEPKLTGAGDAVPEPKGDEEEETEQPAFLGPPPRVWNVVVDPAESLPEYPAKLPYATLEGIRPPRIMTPATPSPFLGIEEGNVDITGFRVVDLRSGETVASVDGMNVSKGPELATGPALSPDGRLTAIFDFSSQSIYVGDLQKRKTQNRFPWEGSDPVLLFAKADTLVAIEPSQRPRVEVWQLPLGARLAAFELEGSPELSPPLVAVSPGGRFLVLCVSGSSTEIATFYDLTTGKEAGTLKLDGDVVAPYFLAFGFSPDGREFAGFMNGLENQGQPAGIHSGVIVWDVETGRPIYQSEYEYDGFQPSAGPISDRPLQWFPDGKGWLLTQSRLFDRESGRVIRSLTEHMSRGQETTGAQILDDRRLLISDASGSAMTIVEDVREAPAKED